MINGTVTAAAKEFAAAVKWATRFADPHPAIPVYAGLLLHAADGELLITAHSETATARATVPYGGDGAGTVLVSARLLDALVSTFPSQPVVLTQDEAASLTINAGRWTGSLPTMFTEDFQPGVTELPIIGTVTGQSFAAAVHRAGVARSIDLKQPVTMHLMHLTFAGDTVTALSTNRHRAATDTAPFSTTFTPEFTALVMADQMMAVADSFTGPDDVLVGLSDSSLSLASPSRSVVLRQIDAEYAMLEQLRGMFVRELPDRATVRAADLTAPLKRAALVRDKDGPVGIRITSDLFSVTAAADQLKQGSTEEIDASYDGPDHEMLFNPKFLADAIGSAPGETVELSFSAGKYLPIIVTSPGNTTWRHLLMPIKKLR